jgi:signal transduction histidine kinase/CheY-like chemotaxis protein
VISLTDYRATLEAGWGRLEGAVELLAHQTNHVLDVSRIATLRIVDVAEARGLRYFATPAGHSALVDMTESSPNIGSLWVMDATGTVVANSLESKPTPVDLSDRPYYAPLKAGADSYITGLLYGRVSKVWFFSYNRAIRIDGAFRGIAQTSVHGEDFRRFYQALQLGPGAAINVYRADGLVVMRWPLAEQEVGAGIAGTPLFERLSRGPSGRVELEGAEPRLEAFARAGDHPLIVTASVPRALALRSFWDRFYRNAVLFALALLGIGLLGGLAARASAREGRVIRKLSEREERLRRSERELRAAHDTFRHLVETSPFGVYAVDADFRLVQVSAGAQNVFRNVRPLIGRDFADVLRTIWPEPFATEAINLFRRTLQTGEPYHAPSTVERRRDIGELESYDWKIERVTLPDGRFGAVCHFYDLSERQRYEAALRENEARLKAQADQLSHLYETLRKGEQRKDEFLATLAHELRNPLAPLQNGLALLARVADEPRRSGEIRAMMERQLDQLVRLIDDLLDLSRITRGKIELRRTRVDVGSAVDRAVEMCRPMLRDRNLELDLPTQPVYVDGDDARLAQVFSNLLHNACKFTAPGGHVRVSVERAAADVVVSIQDDGIGIAPDHLEDVFEIFTQLEPLPGRAHGGLGIGLSLVRKLVELHGGTVKVHSEGPGRGAQFTVQLPAAEAPATEAPAPPQPQAAAAHRVLVVDDNRDAALSLRMLLQLDGSETEVAYDGAEALQKARAFKPELILMDIGMPEMDGYETCRAIRAEPWGRTPTIVALTGLGQERDRRRSEEAGFDAHLVKPVTRDAIAHIFRGPHEPAAR